jgi:aspartate-semialdehyde dehydrogenase
VRKSGISALADDFNGNHEASAKTFGPQIVFNALPKIGDIDETGYSTEEEKIRNESRRFWTRTN